MSGFQIPGLGQARPNEQLPTESFAPDLLVAAASIVGEDVLKVTSADPAQLLQQLQKPKTEEKKDDNAMEVDSKPSDITPTKTQEDVSMANHSDNKQQTATENSTTSNLDSPPSPDVTSTLEAALDGMMGAPTSSATMTNGEVQDGAQDAQEEEHPEWEEDSSPYESSSESSSDSSSDEDSDDEDAHPILGVEETVRMLMAGIDDEEEDGNKGKGAGAPLRTKNEIVEEVIPKPEVVITPDMTIEPLAHVEFIVENTVVMKSRVPGEVKVLDLGSVLCKEDRTVIGALAEIIGNVKSPMYTCVFANQEEIKQLGLEVGTHIFYSVDHANYVFTQELKKQKGTDASNLHDEEVGADEMEFSDDEKEAEYKKQLKMKKRGGKAGRGGLREHVLRDQSHGQNTGYAPSTASSATLDASSVTLSYDDDDGPYRPLARPAGFGQGGPPSLPPKPEVGFGAAHGGQGQRGGFSRGNRGEFRGRGQRGGSRGADRKPGGYRGGRGGAAAPSYGGHDSASASQFPNPQLPPIPTNVQIPPPPFGGAAPPMPGGQWPHIPMPFPPPPMPFPRPSTQSPVPPPQLAGPFNFNFQAWSQAQGQQYQYPQQPSSSAPASQQQSSAPSYPHQAPAVPPAWPGVPPPPPVAGAYVNPAFFQQLQAQAQHAQQHAQQAQQAQQPQQPQQPQQQQQQQQQYWGQQQHNAYGQAPK